MPTSSFIIAFPRNNESMDSTLWKAILCLLITNSFGFRVSAFRIAITRYRTSIALLQPVHLGGFASRAFTSRRTAQQDLPDATVPSEYRVVSQFPLTSKSFLMPLLEAWARNIVGSGSSMNVKISPETILFRFKPSNSASLELRVHEDGDKVIVDYGVVQPTEARLQSLLQMTIHGLIESLTSELEIAAQKLIRHTGYSHNPTEVAVESLAVNPVVIDETFHTDDEISLARDPVIGNDKSIPDEDRTPSPVIVESEPEESCDEDSLRKYDKSIVQHWQNLPQAQFNPERVRVVTRFVQHWAKSFTRKGIGMVSTPSEDGVSLGFLSREGVSVDIHVRSDNGVCVTAEVTTTASNGHPQNDNPDLDFLSQPRNRIVSELQEELRKLDLARITSENNGMFSQASGDSDQLDSLSDVESALAALKSSLKSMESSSSREEPKKQRMRDPVTAVRAQELGVDLDEFERNQRLQDDAARQLKDIVDRSRQQGFYQVIAQYDDQIKANNNNQTSVPKASEAELDELFRLGRDLSELQVERMLDRPTNNPYYETDADLAKPPAQLPVLLENAGELLSGAKVDILAGPEGIHRNTANPTLQQSSSATSTSYQTSTYQQADHESATAESDLQELMRSPQWQHDLLRLQQLLTEMERAGPALYDLVLDGFRDLMMSDNMLLLLRQANRQEQPPQRRAMFARITARAGQLYEELVALIEKESVRHLKTIAAICEAATLFKHDQRKFLDRLDELRPLFDMQLLAYLNHAAAVEEARLQREQEQLRLPVREDSRWLQVLRVVHHGVLAEFEARYDSILDLVLNLIRFEDARIRRPLFQRLVKLTAPSDLGYFRVLALNMADRALSGKDPHLSRVLPQHPSVQRVIGEFRQEIDVYLSEEIVQTRLQTYMDELAKQGKELHFVHRNPQIQQELEELERQVQAFALSGERSARVSAGLLGRGLAPPASAT